MKYNLHLFETAPPTNALTEEMIKAAIASMPKADLLKLGSVNDIVTQVRQEEKTKLYSTMQTMQDSLRTLTERAEAADREKQAALEEQRKQLQDKMSFEERMAQQRAEFDSKFNELRQTAQEQVNAVQKEFSTYQLNVARVQLAEAAGLPKNFHKFVTGSTIEEIKASVDELLAEVKAITPAPTPTIVQPGTQPNSVTTIVPPANNGIVDPSTIMNPKSPAEITSYEYSTDPEKRQKALEEAKKTYFGALTQAP